MKSLALSLSLVALGACDLEEKQIGDETESGSASESESGSASETGGECVDGEIMEGECGDCVCESGVFSCQEGCNPTTAGSECVPGDTMPADDGCNTCECTEDGTWACTEIDCGGGGECTGGQCCDIGPGEDGGPAYCFDCSHPGERIGGSNCHVCTCLDDGSWDCDETADQLPAGDGCNDCVCDPETGAWSCTTEDCDPDPGADTNPFDGEALATCGEDVPQDALVINGYTFEDDNLLILDVAYSGGCAKHLLGGCWDGEFQESSPVQVSLFVAHDGMNDACDAFPSDQVTIDLTPLRDAYEEAYGEYATVLINLEGLEDSIQYDMQP